MFGPWGLSDKNKAQAREAVRRAETARASTVRKVLADLLGRDPTDGELATVLEVSRQAEHVRAANKATVGLTAIDELAKLMEE